MNEEKYFEFSHRQEPWELDDGRLITSDGEELFTAYLLPTVGRLVLVREFKPRLSAATPVTRLLGRSVDGDGEPPYVSRRPAKARSSLLRYNLHNRLSMSGTLTLAIWDEGLIRPLRKFIEGLRDELGEAFPWTAAAEFGEKGNPHWHLCLPGDFSVTDLENQWGVFALSVFKPLAENGDIVRWSAYMGKTFELRLGERPTYRRFHSGPGFNPKTIRIERLTRQNAERLADKLSSESGSEFVEWTGPDAWCPIGFFWPT